jgi:uncharacterized damage-inducible protein DinB
MDEALVGRFESNWLFVRGLTMDLLRSLEPADLGFRPGDQVGLLWKHFRHLGRIQENYLHALDTGSISFGFDGVSHSGGASKESLQEYLKRLDSDLSQRLKSPGILGKRIDWFGEHVDLGVHLSRMTEHERLHQGMLVVYVRLLNRKFPVSWKAWGL